MQLGRGTPPHPTPPHPTPMSASGLLVPTPPHPKWRFQKCIGLSIYWAFRIFLVALGAKKVAQVRAPGSRPVNFRKRHLGWGGVGTRRPEADIGVGWGPKNCERTRVRFSDFQIFRFSMHRYHFGLHLLFDSGVFLEPSIVYRERT